MRQKVINLIRFYIPHHCSSLKGDTGGGGYKAFYFKEMKEKQLTYENMYKPLKEAVDGNLYTKVTKDRYDQERRELKIKKGLFILGVTGSGKTASMRLIAGRVGLGESYVNNWVELLFELKDRFSTGGVRSLIDNITERNFIFLDDVGAEKNSDWALEMLYLIINRCEREKGLFISTNLSAEEFTSRYGERIMSRIAFLCEVVQMEDKDYRLE